MVLTAISVTTAAGVLLAITTQSKLLSLLVSFVVWCPFLIRRIREQRRYRVRVVVQGEPSSHAVEPLQTQVEKDDRFLRRMDSVYVTVVSVGLSILLWLMSHIISIRTYAGFFLTTLLFISALMPLSLQMAAMVKNSIVGRIDSWIALMAVVTTDLHSLVYVSFFRPFVMPFVVPQLMHSIRFGAIYGVIAGLIAAHATYIFSVRTVRFYRYQLRHRSCEVPQSMKAFRGLVYFCMTVCSFLSFIAYTS